jgi:hypothetical protein
MIYDSSSISRVFRCWLTSIVYLFRLFDTLDLRWGQCAMIGSKVPGFLSLRHCLHYEHIRRRGFFWFDKTMLADRRVYSSYVHSNPFPEMTNIIRVRSQPACACLVVGSEYSKLKPI